PVDGYIRLRVVPAAPERFTLRLRIPHWSRQTRVSVNGETALTPAPGCYCELDREWRPSDIVELSLDMGLRLWAGERECEGKASLYRGPLLLAYDPRFDSLDLRSRPTFDPTCLEESEVRWTLAPQPLLQRRLNVAQGQQFVLCDFASAGATGTPYVSW